jgi:hypothetical protein
MNRRTTSLTHTTLRFARPPPSQLLKLVAGFLPLPSYAALLSTHSSLRCDIDHSSVFEQLAKSRFGKDYLDDFYSRVKNKDLTWKEKLRSQLQGR